MVPNKWLMIENDGVAPIESFTVLGVSSARGKSSKIGQFGSGAKHAVLVLIRHGLYPTIYFGKDKMEFLTKPKSMGSVEFHQVGYSLNGGAVKELSWSTEFGELDWKSVDMAMREFLSNAIDQSGVVDTDMEIVDKPRAKDGRTRVFVPYNPLVKEWFENRAKFFLHYQGKDDERFLQKETPSPARIYRKGVFIRELQYRGDSLYDYNFGDELRIDESRNLDDSTVLSAMGEMITTDKEVVKSVLLALEAKQRPVEATIHEYYLDKQDNRVNVALAWKELFGDAMVAKGQMFADFAAKKGFRAIVIERDNWYQTLKNAGIKEAISLGIGDILEKGYEEVPATEKAIANRDKVWEWLLDINATGAKSKPPVKCFSKAMDAEQVLRGHYDKGTQTVLINVDNDWDEAVMLEEITHYITGAGDLSRDLQDYAFNIAVRTRKLLE
jgi:hypothetical protein